MLLCFQLELYETDKESGQKKFIGVRIEPPFKLNVSEHETRILDSFNESFKRIALDIQIINSTCVNIRSAPVCILKKAMMEVRIKNVMYIHLHIYYTFKVKHT